MARALTVALVSVAVQALPFFRVGQFLYITNGQGSNIVYYSGLTHHGDERNVLWKVDVVHIILRI